MLDLEEIKGSEAIKKAYQHFKELNKKEILNFMDILKEIILWMATLMLLLPMDLQVILL